MTTLLNQLKFLCDSRDNSTSLYVGADTITLTVKNASDKALVQRIASKMAIASSVDKDGVKLHVATPLKEQDILPETEFQKIVKRLIFGHGGVMGLQELLGYMYSSNKYSGNSVYASLSAIEKSYIRASGWDLDFRSGLGYVEGKITNVPGRTEVGVENTLLTDFLTNLRKRGHIQYIDTKNLMCGYGKDYYRSSDIMDSAYKDRLFSDGDYGRSFEDLVGFFSQNVLAFPNGERITLDLVNKRSLNNGYKHDYMHDFEWKITPPSTQSRWYSVVCSMKSAKSVEHFHSQGILQEFLDVEHCECKPKEVSVPRESMKLIRDALASYMEGGVYSSFDHAIVGDELQVWLTKGIAKTGRFNPSQLRKTRKAFDSAVRTLRAEVLESYENPITIR